jgi:hypothetical protein
MPRSDKEGDDNPDKHKYLKHVVETTLDESEDAWEEEEKSERYQEIKTDAEALRKKIHDQHPGPGYPWGKEAESALIAMTYNAASRLADALRELLRNPLRVANVPKILGRDGIGAREVNGWRRGFIISILEVLDEMNITIEDLKEIKRQIDEIDNES